jgi:predicted secreted protein
MLLPAFAAEFGRYRSMSERAAAQLPWPLLRIPLDPQTNSIAVIMKHVAGNLRSRWTDPFTSDGEKPWRNRDTEFIDDFAADESGRADLDAHWRAGWTTLESTLATLSDSDLPRTLTIRGEPHTLALALTRSLSHTAYHAGQVVQLARALAEKHNVSWATLTIPRAGSADFNAKLGYTPQ